MKEALNNVIIGKKWRSNMKRRVYLLFLFAFICQVSVLFCDDKDENVGKWVEHKGIMRSVLIDTNNINELERFDETLLEEIRLKDIAGFEKNVAGLLKNIIIDKVYSSNNNAANAFLLLQDKLTDKKYFFDIVYSVANYKMVSNHFVLSAILQGFRKYITTDPDKMFLSLSIMGGYIDSYIISPQKEGTKIIISDLIGFLQTYMVTVKGGGLDSKYDKYIFDLYNKIGFSGRSSSFDNYKGADDLKKEYSTYTEIK